MHDRWQPGSPECGMPAFGSPHPEKSSEFHPQMEACLYQYMMSMLVSGPDKAGLHVSISKN